ncbi:MAG: hypothetical protein HC767_08640 [Akkermansiaceae bacterium]|nr:hypothetical protein [Akkermansiaceae bacterium]
MGAIAEIAHSGDLFYQFFCLSVVACSAEASRRKPSHEFVTTLSDELTLSETAIRNRLAGKSPANVNGSGSNTASDICFVDQTP